MKHMFLLVLALAGLLGVSVSHAQAPVKEPVVGTASYYGKTFHGKRTASGDLFDKDAFTAAHRSLPFGTKVKVTNLRNKRSVVVVINDRGGFGKYDRIIDVSRAAASELGMRRRGVARVRLEVLK